MHWITSKFGFIDAFKEFFKNYFNFKGKENRKNFWWAISTLCMSSVIPTVYLIYIFIGISMNVSGGTSSAKTIIMNTFYHEKLPLSLIFMSIVVLIIPCMSLYTRRFKDTGLTGLSFLILFLSSNLFIIQSIISLQNNNMLFSKDTMMFPIIGITLWAIIIIITILPSNFMTVKSKSKIFKYFIL